MRSLLLPFLVAAAGCLVVPPHVTYRSPGAPPPAARAERLLSESEAIDIARGEAAARGVQVDGVKNAHLDGDGRWHVDLRGRRHEKAKVIVDARSGRVLKADVKAGKGGKGKHGRHGEEDEDDDD
jgi:hypothetical protein